MKSQPENTAASASRFDAEAAMWDENPRRRELTDAIAQAIQQDVELGASWRVLEYGCGTASLGFRLAPHVAEVVAADASTGMIEQVHRKLAQSPGVRLTPLLLDLSRQEAPAERFDLIVAAMIMHHVTDLDQLWTKLATMLVSTGVIAVADLCAEDGSFHGPARVPHNGFEPEALSETIQRCVGKASWQCRVIHKYAKNGVQYEVFLLTMKRAGETPASS